ncbi:MAG: hypothetical protein M1401_01920 [Chloroflexi bacterium]|nr:hypothetical protein [Chloroflexota bacterium]MCL5107636.1 hypothetical protein [Chloroflexota bacterium]
MRNRIVSGLLGLGVGLGGLLGLFLSDRMTSPPNDPLIDEYVRIVGALYARGESLSQAQARLGRLGYGEPARLVENVAAHGGQPGETPKGDLATILVALAPPSSSPAESTPRVVASGRGAGPTTTVIAGAAAAPRPTPEFPRPGRLAAGRTEATLRTKATTDSPALRIVRQDTAFVVLALEHGQPVEGAEDRWYKVSVGDTVGYIYLVLVENPL